MNAIVTAELCCRYGRTEALAGLNLTVPGGSLCALLGANGAGKTTALKVLVNLLQPSAGNATVLGVDSRSLGERELARIGYVAENQRQPEWMTVRQFLDYCRAFYPTWDRALEARLLTDFALPVDRPLQALSRGMRMKAVLLSSLTYRPALLVLDEPFSGLDPVVREDVTQGLLAAVQQGETTAIISSHDVEEVERLADHMALLEAGRLRFAEPTDQLLARFRRVEVEQEGSMSGVKLPATWLNWQAGRDRATFVDSAYHPVTTGRACRERFPSATVRAHPMTLREIFIAHARRNQMPTPGVAA